MCGYDVSKYKHGKMREIMMNRERKIISAQYYE